MGIASPVWLRAIDIAGSHIAATVNHNQAITVNFEATQNTTPEGGQR
jgi:NADH-quinone oxidoreductase subunit M